MSETTITPTTPVPTAPPSAPVHNGEPAATPNPEPIAQRDAADEPLGEKGLKALQRERAERERVERELAPMREQMQKLAAIFGGESADPAKDIVTTLQEQVAEMRRDTLVSDVARRHGITDDADVALLRKVSDPADMQHLAERLKASNTPPSSPAPDPSQASAPISEEAAAEAAYQAFYPSGS